jgi:hypothetical protein
MSGNCIAFNTTTTLSKTVRVGAYLSSNYSILPSANAPFCRNQTVQFGLGYWMVPDATYYNWVWSGATYISGQGTRVVTLRMPASVSGSNPYVSVGLSVGNACGNTSFLPFTVFSINPNCYSSSPFKVSPNPAYNEIKVEPEISKEIARVTTQNADILEVVVVDKMGLVKLKSKMSKGTKQANINVSGLPSDVYTIRIFDGQNWHAHKIIIQH